MCVLDEFAVGLGEVSDAPGEEGHGHEDSDADTDGEVVGRRDQDDGGGQHGRLGLGHPPQRGGLDAVPVEGADRDHDQDRHQCGHRDDSDHVTEADDQDEQEDTGHAAEEPRDDVRGALTPGFTGLVVGVGDVVDGLGGQQRLQDPDERHRQRTENAIASGIKARATTRPARTSVRSIFGERGALRTLGMAGCAGACVVGVLKRAGLRSDQPVGPVAARGRNRPTWLRE